MKKILIFLLLFLTPFTTKAYFCNYNDRNAALKKALNVNLMVEYEILDDQAVFTINIYNLKEKQYIIDKQSGKRYNYDGSDTLKLVVLKPGFYSFEIYSDENYCDEDSLALLTASIPTYNKFYKDDLCKGIENYKFCQKWFSTSITYEEFKKAIEDYKEELVVEQTPSEEEYKSIYSYILEFYVKYWFIILPTIIVVCLLMIVLKKRQENKFRL